MSLSRITKAREAFTVTRICGLVQEIAAYLAEEQDRLKAREESHIKAMLAREVGGHQGAREVCGRSAASWGE